MADKKSRKVLQFNEYDFRHKKALEVLNSHPRNMTELVVNAILHYISCPDASLELTKQSIRKLVAEVLMEMQADGSLSISNAAAPSGAAVTSTVSQSDLDELGDVMGQLRRKR